MIQAILLASLLTMFHPAALPKDPPVRLATYRCADAVVGVGVIRTDEGPRFDITFEAGKEACEEEITAVQPVMFEGKRCVIFWFGYDHVSFCLPDNGLPPQLPGIGI